MRLLAIIIILLFTTMVFAQRHIKNGHILVDGNPITYQDYKLLDLTGFAEIKVLPGNEDIVGIFGKKAKRGIVHLKSTKFINDQNILLDELTKTLAEGSPAATLFVVNGIVYDPTELKKYMLGRLNSENVETIAVLENDGLLFNNKRVIVIQTNVKL